MSITPHGVLIVTDKAQTESVLRIYLGKVGLKQVYAAHTLREAWDLANRECPHIVVIESGLPDCTPLDLLKKLRAESFFQRVPVVIITKPSREEILEYVKYKVSAILGKPVEPNAFMEKMKAIAAAIGNQSPYGLGAQDVTGGAGATLRFPAQVMGRDANHLICHSPLSIPEGTKVFICPEDKNFAPIIAASGSPLRSETTKDSSKETNLFGIHNLVGKGRAWVMQLPTLGSTQDVDSRRVLFFDGSKDRVSALSRILSFHDIEIDMVDTVQRLSQRLTQGHSEFNAVYMAEMPVGSAGIPWEKALTALPAGKRPVHIIGTSVAAPKQRPGIIWMQKPFGIDQLVEAIETAFFHHDRPDVGTKGEGAAKGISCHYQIRGTLASLDETGGIIQLDLCPMTGTQVTLDCPAFAGSPDLAQVKLCDAEQNPEDPRLWNVRFQFLSPGVSAKGTFWKAKRDLFRKKEASAPAPAV